MTPAQTAFLALLRSGEIPQTRGALQNLEGATIQKSFEAPPEPVPAGMCCLGVACEAFRRTTGQGHWAPAGDKHMGFISPGMEEGFHDDPSEAPSEAECLPIEVAAWLGLDSSSPDLEPDLRAIHANDDLQWSFSRIADAFEKLFREGETK